LLESLSNGERANFQVLDLAGLSLFALDRLGQFSDAIEPLRKATFIDPDYAEAHFQLATVLARLGQTEEAAKERSISTAIQAKQQADYTRKPKESQLEFVPRDRVQTCVDRRGPIL
jgi:Flp pilus assembly protein TadD